MNNQVDYTKSVIASSLDELKSDYERFGFTGDRLTAKAADDQTNYLYFIRDEINRQIKATRAAAKKAAANN